MIVCARSRPDALKIACGLISRGRRNVVISTPDGSALMADRPLPSTT